MKKTALSCALALLLALSLSGCVYADETGAHFMLLGTHGAVRNGQPIAAETPQETAGAAQEPAEPSDFSALTFFRGWDDGEGYAFRGKGVCVKKDCDLVRTDLAQEKQIELLVRLKRSAGSYALVLRSPDGGEEVLCDAAQAEETLTVPLQAGESVLYLRCEDAAFDSIDLLVRGLELEDFSE